MRFSNVVNLSLEDVILNGSMDIDKTSINNSDLKMTVNMKRILYNGLVDSKDNCLNLYGNIDINDSKFYGSPFCEDSVIYYNGENVNSINISNSYFNGMYSNNCINISNGFSTNINSSSFENCSEHFEGG